MEVLYFVLLIMKVSEQFKTTISAICFIIIRSIIDNAMKNFQNVYNAFCELAKMNVAAE